MNAFFVQNLKHMREGEGGGDPPYFHIFFKHLLYLETSMYSIFVFDFIFKFSYRYSKMQFADSACKVIQRLTDGLLQQLSWLSTILFQAARSYYVQCKTLYFAKFSILHVTFLPFCMLQIGCRQPQELKQKGINK